VGSYDGSEGVPVIAETSFCSVLTVGYVAHCGQSPIRLIPVRLIFRNHQFQVVGVGRNCFDFGGNGLRLDRSQHVSRMPTQRTTALPGNQKRSFVLSIGKNILIHQNDESATFCSRRFLLSIFVKCLSTVSRAVWISA